MKISQPSLFYRCLSSSWRLFQVLKLITLQLQRAPIKDTCEVGGTSRAMKIGGLYINKKIQSKCSYWLLRQIGWVNQWGSQLAKSITRMIHMCECICVLPTRGARPGSVLAGATCSPTWAVVKDPDRVWTGTYIVRSAERGLGSLSDPLQPWSEPSPLPALCELFPRLETKRFNICTLTESQAVWVYTGGKTHTLTLKATGPDPKGITLYKVEK